MMERMKRKETITKRYGVNHKEKRENFSKKEKNIKQNGKR